MTIVRAGHDRHPQVSVIIATYNRANYIRETVESNFRQGFRDYELIDDGSTDGTRKVLEPYDSQLRYVYQENAGPSTARNVGYDMRRRHGLHFKIQTICRSRIIVGSLVNEPARL